MRGGRTGRKGNRRCMSFRRRQKIENRKEEIEKRRSRFNAEDTESAEYAEKSGLEAGMRWTVGELAKAIEARLEGDGTLEITGVAAPERAGAKQLIYVEAAKHAERAAGSVASCVVAPEGIALDRKS